MRTRSKRAIEEASDENAQTKRAKETEQPLPEIGAQQVDYISTVDQVTVAEVIESLQDGNYSESMHRSVDDRIGTLGNCYTYSLCWILRKQALLRRLYFLIRMRRNSEGLDLRPVYTRSELNIVKAKAITAVPVGTSHRNEVDRYLKALQEQVELSEKILMSSDDVPADFSEDDVGVDFDTPPFHVMLEGSTVSSLEDRVQQDMEHCLKLGLPILPAEAATEASSAPVLSQIPEPSPERCFLQ
jgi:hypothetical protein